ncbi:MAG: rod shape-determining protein MreC [Prevotella sp.]|nr:rod shape-determining protein MreC [Prevotella sp.]
MQNLLSLLARSFHWLLFIVLEGISVALLFSYNSYQGSVWVSSANSVAGKVYEWQSGVEQYFGLKSRAQDLALRNYRLELELSKARAMLHELAPDTAATDSLMQQAYSNLHLVPAQVVASTLDHPDNLITIDRGLRDGIKPDMGVVSGMGVVGVVYMAGEHYSVVLPLLNSHSRISCAIRGSQYFGYLMWDGRNPALAYMEDVPRHAQFNSGQWVETSGFSAIFPPGITVGQITGIGNSADGLSYRLTIRLSADFGNLRDVFVIDNSEMDYDERHSLLQAARDSLRNH